MSHLQQKSHLSNQVIHFWINLLLTSLPSTVYVDEQDNALAEMAQPLLDGLDRIVQYIKLLQERKFQKIRFTVRELVKKKTFCAM